MEVDEDEGRWDKGVKKGVHRLKFGVGGGRLRPHRVELSPGRPCVSRMRFT